MYIGDLKLFGQTDKGLDSLIHIVRIFSSDICMEFGIEKWNILILKRGIKDKNYDIMLGGIHKVRTQ